MSSLWAIATKAIRKLLYSRHNEVVAYWFHSVRPSICPSARPASSARSVAPSVLVGFISYLYIFSSNFKRCVACKVSGKIESLAFFSKVVTLSLSYFDFGSRMGKHGAAGVSQNADILVVLVGNQFIGRIVKVFNNSLYHDNQYFYSGFVQDNMIFYQSYWCGLYRGGVISWKLWGLIDILLDSSRISGWQCCRRALMTSILFQWQRQHLTVTCHPHGYKSAFRFEI